MGKYIVRRLLWMVVVLFFVSLITFGIFFIGQTNPAKAIVGTHATPDTLQRVTQYYGFDKPIYVQYVRYMRHLLAGDLGTSYQTQRPVRQSLLPLAYSCTFRMPLQP